MLGVNKIILLGFIGRDPQLRYTAEQEAVLTLPLATHKSAPRKQGSSKKDDSSSQQQTQWHQLMLRGRLAEFCANQLVKGSKVYVEGSLEYVTKHHAEYKQAKWQEAVVVVSQVQLIDGLQSEPYPEDFPQLDKMRTASHSKKTRTSPKKDVSHHQKNDLFD